MATGLGASQIAPSDESAWSAFAVGNDENASSYEDKGSNPPPRSLSQPRPRKSNGQLRNGDLNSVNRADSTTRSDDSAGPSSKASRDRLRSGSADRPRVRRKTSRGIVAMLEDDIPEDEHSKWIHRDKLAAIESRELAEMGLRVRHSRSTSRARSSRGNKASIDAAEGNGPPMPDSAEDGRISRSDKRIRTKSPVSGDDEHILEEHDSPEGFSRPGTSSGQSRLPVSRHTNPYESQSPESPTHGRSGSRELHMQKQRLRSQSGTLLPEDSPIQRDANGKKIPPSSARKASAANAVGSSGRKYSSDSSSPVRPQTAGRSRPGTRNGVPSNPVNRPDGEPPWINEMYKPDPRLPPDQQMLPTHAKRMAELQRDADRRAAEHGSEGDSEFVLLESEGSGTDQPTATSQSPKKSTANKSPQPGQSATVPNAQGSPRKNQTANRESGQWPLHTPEMAQQPHMQDAYADASQYNHRRTVTTDSNNARGGYNLMPSIQTQQEQEKAIEMQQARLSMSGRPNGQTHGRHLSAEQWQQNASLAPVHQPVTLNPVDDEKAKKKKNKDNCLGCCVVM